MITSNKHNISTQMVVLAAVFGASGVILGAFGAHALKASLELRGMASVWDTAVKYQLFHAVALLALAGWVEARLIATVQPDSSFVRSMGRVAWLFAGGMLLFSGSLYLLALGAPNWVGIITPFGGVALVAAWIWLGVAAWRIR
jgi:uncharacterized membrane protein YgdD (TMEM256/DUF423 family)